LTNIKQGRDNRFEGFLLSHIGRKSKIGVSPQIVSTLESEFRNSNSRGEP
jgi:hypothetical protein